MTTESAGAIRDTYTRLIHLLNEHEATYRLIDHDPEGRTEIVSAMRGNPLAAAAKCMVMIVKPDKKTTRYVLAVVPGDSRVSFPSVAALFDARYVAIASPDIAEQLGKSVTGTILPFTFEDRLELLVDPLLLRQSEIYFNAGRLDRSVALATADWVRIARPRLAEIVESSPRSEDMP